MNALSLDGLTGDYVLNTEFDTVSINIGNICVYICVRDWGVSVDLQSLYQESKDALATTWVSFEEAECER